MSRTTVITRSVVLKAPGTTDPGHLRRDLAVYGFELDAEEPDRIGGLASADTTSRLPCAQRKQASLPVGRQPPGPFAEPSPFTEPLSRRSLPFPPSP